MKLRANRKRKMGDDSFDELDDEIEGKRSYNVEEKLWADNYDADHVLNKTGQEVNYNFFQENGFTKPVLIKDSDGLGMMIPPESFTVDDVMSHVGADRVIEVMNALTQASKEWSMEEWVAYYNSSRLSRKKVLNVISLEFTGTTLDPLVEGPAVVREMDWVQKVWPLDLRYIDLNKHKSDVTFPKVLKYCLMSVGGCFTDFHIDLGGTSVWYHILKGKKVFWLIPPTEENLKAYETWSLSGEQEHSFLADACKGCQRIVINQGNTLLIPTGWIHAVYTPIDSLVFGGNFLHSFNIGLQLRIAAIEQNLKVGAKYRYPFFDEMQWYVYEHYNIALTGKSFSSIDGKATLEYCEVPAEPLLNSHELQGLRHLREWLGNQPDGSWPEDMENPKGLLTSMMIALSNHSGDPKLISAHSGKSLLQWKPSSLDKYKEQWKTNIMKTKIPKPVSNPPPQKSQPAAATKSPAVSAQRPSISSPNKVNSSTKERSKRCGRCKGCQAPNCTRCTYCKDMVKYGGTGRMRQSCIERVCEVVQSKTTKKNVSSGLVSAFDDEPEGLTGSGGPANDKHIARLVKIFNESTGDALTTSHGQDSDLLQTSGDIKLETVDEEQYADPYESLDEQTDKLPMDEVMVTAFTYLTPAERCICALVCKRWRIAARNRQFFKRLDLSKMVLADDQAQFYGRLQPEELFMNMAIASPDGVLALLSQLRYTKVVSLKGVAAVSRCDLGCIPDSVEELSLAAIPDLTDSTLVSLFQKDTSADSFGATKKIRRSLKIRSLDLSQTSIADSCLRQIARFLPKMTRLVLSNCPHLTSLSMEYLSFSTPTLEYLDFRGCSRLDSTCLSHLQRSGFSRLNTLVLDDCDLVSISEIKKAQGAAKKEGIHWISCRKTLSRELTQDIK